MPIGARQKTHSMLECEEATCPCAFGCRPGQRCPLPFLPRASLRGSCPVCVQRVFPRCWSRTQVRILPPVQTTRITKNRGCKALRSLPPLPRFPSTASGAIRCRTTSTRRYIDNRRIFIVRLRGVSRRLVLRTSNLALVICLGISKSFVLLS